MKKLETREQAEARAMELFPNEYAGYTSILIRESERKAFLQCFDEMQANKQTCGFCVEPKELEMIECPDCNGEGTWYNDTSRECTTYRGDCCGGCGYYVDCDNCNGTGEIEKEEE